MIPQFPNFKPLSLHDRDVVRERLMRFQPVTSELTFANLYIWQAAYHIGWSVHEDWLFFAGSRDEQAFALPPVGPGPRKDAALALLAWQKDDRGIAEPRIERADRALVTELENEPSVRIMESRDQYDYVYRSRDLIELSGNRYHSKRNHIHAMQKKYEYRYDPMKDMYVRQCTELVEKWCGIKRCEEDMNLLGEWDAVGEMLAHFEQLQVRGGVLLIEDRVAAFAFGELLNPTTAVVHIEKADPDIRELYTVINQQFSEHSLHDVAFINREQDLGQPGLRKAKMSYHPDHLVEKFTIIMNSTDKAGAL
jgi:hypothetical protein